LPEPWEPPSVPWCTPAPRPPEAPEVNINPETAPRPLVPRGIPTPSHTPSYTVTFTHHTPSPPPALYGPTIHALGLP